MGLVSPPRIERPRNRLQDTGLRGYAVVHNSRLREQKPIGDEHTLVKCCYARESNNMCKGLSIRCPLSK